MVTFSLFFAPPSFFSIEASDLGPAGKPFFCYNPSKSSAFGALISDYFSYIFYILRAQGGGFPLLFCLLGDVLEGERGFFQLGGLAC